MNYAEKSALAATARATADTANRLRATATATQEFLEVHGKPAKKPRQPLMGEEMKLTHTLAPRYTLIAMHHALGTPLPPLILTYTGQRTGAVVSNTMRI